MKLYVMSEYDKKGEYTNKEYYSSEKERDERVLIRKGRTFGIETETLSLPKDTWQLGYTTNLTKADFEELQIENKKLRALLKSVRETANKLCNI